jgi:hypothetical protein
VDIELEEARTAATQAQQHAAASEAQVLALLTGLLPEGRKTYLGRSGLTELDVYGLNHTLHRRGLALQHDLPSQEYAELLVKIRTAEGHYEGATRFWLVPYSPPEEPVIDGIPAKYIVHP